MAAAKALVKSVKQESIEIESCSECYFAANTKENWFIDVCSKPHLIVWAKLKGFPFWPAKVMGISMNSMVSVRFFGDHDRAQIPIKECYLYSKDSPCPGGKKNNRSDLQNCISEVETHIDKLKLKYGTFEYAPAKTPYDPNKENEQLNQMLPKFKDYIEKQTTKPNTGLQFKIYKTSDNNLSMTKIQNPDNSEITPTTEVPKKPHYDNVPTKVVLKRRPSGEYVVENKRGKPEKPQKPTTNTIVAEIMRKNQGESRKILTVVDKSKTVKESFTAPPHNPFVIKTEPVDEYEENPVDFPVDQQSATENTNITNISVNKQERTGLRPRRNATVEPVNSFEMSSNMVCIPLATSSSESSGPTTQTPRPEPRSNSPSAGPFSRRLKDNAQKMTEFFESVLLNTYNDMAKDGDVDALLMTLRLEFEKEKEHLNKIITQKTLQIAQKNLEIQNSKAEIESTKRKQWCANCWKEAHLYCCWNTTYCSYNCQTNHWTVHSPICNNSDNAASSSNVLLTTTLGGPKRKSENLENNRFVSIVFLLLLIKSEILLKFIPRKVT